MESLYIRTPLNKDTTVIRTACAVPNIMIMYILIPDIYEDNSLSGAIFSHPKGVYNREISLYIEFSDRYIGCIENMQQLF